MDPKSMLSQYCQKNKLSFQYNSQLSHYDPQTNTRFFSSSVKILPKDKEYFSAYTWKTIKEAEKDCAEVALKFLLGKEYIHPLPIDLEKSTDKSINITEPNIMIWVDLDQSLNFVNVLKKYSPFIKQIRYFCNEVLRDKAEKIIKEERDTIKFVPSLLNMTDSYLTYDLYQYIFNNFGFYKGWGNNQIFIISKDKFTENIKYILKNERGIDIELVKSVIQFEELIKKNQTLHSE